MDIASLLSDPAQKFIGDHQKDDPVQLMLNQKGVPGVSLRELVLQIKARTLVRSKIPTWFNTPGMVYGESKSLEQCSSEQTAIYKSQLVSGNHMVDLTGGLGVDSFFLGKSFNKVTYIEKDSLLCRLANHNFGVLGADHIKVVTGDASKVFPQLTGPVDFIYLDPDRRPGDLRRFKLEEYQPLLPAVLPPLWTYSERIMLKLGPMLDVQQVGMILGNVQQVHVISVKNECKELVYILEYGFTGPIQFTATNMSAGGTVQSFSYKQEEEDISQPQYSEPLKYLYEPNSSILKLGAFKLICDRFELNKLHPNSHLYTSDSLVEGFPGRAFEVQWTTSYKPDGIRKKLSTDKANITVRNFVKDVNAIRKECGLKEGGTDYLFATTGPKGQLMVANGHRLPNPT